MAPLLSGRNGCPARAPAAAVGRRAAENRAWSDLLHVGPTLRIVQDHPRHPYALIARAIRKSRRSHAGAHSQQGRIRRAELLVRRGKEWRWKEVHRPGARQRFYERRLFVCTNELRIVELLRHSGAGNSLKLGEGGRSLLFKLFELGACTSAAIFESRSAPIGCTLPHW